MDERTHNLTLSRKAGDTLRIGTATVIFKKVKGNRVVVTVAATKDVVVVRGEVERKAA